MQLKKLLFLTTFFCCFVSSKAQVNIDSLKVVWNDVTQSDTTRLEAIKILAWDGYRMNNPDSAFHYARLQYDLAESTGHKKWMTSSLKTQGTLNLMKSDLDKALDFYSRCIILSDEINNQEDRASCLNNTGIIYQQKGDYEKSLEYYNRSLKILKELDDQNKIGQVFYSIGVLYKLKGNLDEALEYFDRGLKISKEFGNLANETGSLNAIATIYEEQGDFEEALKLYANNIINYKKLGNKIGVAGTLGNMGRCYSTQGEYIKAMENLTASLKVFEEMGYKQGVAGMSQNIGLVYFKQKDYDLALDYNTQSLKLFEEIGNKDEIPGALSILSSIYAALKDYDKAISIGNNGLAMSRESGNVRVMKEVSENLVESYEAIGNYKKAFEMNELYFQMRDSLASKENQKAIIQMQVQADYDKQKAIDDIENEKEVAIEIQKTDALQKISIAIGSGLLLISFLSLIIFNRLKETRQQKAVIEEQKKKVEQSEKYKEQFLANMSHEIRTPMHAISGMTKILRRNEHPPTQDVYLNAMQTSTENLVVILNDVLDLSKIEAGKLEVEQIPMNPESVIVNVVQLLKFKAEEKGLVLSYDIADNVPDFVLGDATRLNQILLNLAGNAIKFTEKGKVDISLTIENEELRFSVKDTGIGVAQEKLEHIFEAFEQAKESTSRFYGGTGLGLSISKQLVELQQGKIWAESTRGQGSTFYVTLPLTLAAENAVGQDIISAENLKMMTTSLQGIRILIAEDNPFNQMIAQDDLSYYLNDVTIETVENGALAVEKFKSNSYDLILMDVQMPEMNGFEATKEIRKIENQEGRSAKIPIIAMTASLLKTEIDSCYTAGMNNYIPKPYKLEELIGPIFKELN